MSSSDHWREHARRWALFGPPLRPVREEVAFVEQAMVEGLAGRASATAIVLGVTPELVGGRWPPGARVVAVDRSPEMIGALWPPPAGERTRAICADWRALPFLDGKIDAIAADGSLNALPDAPSVDRLVAELARVLRADGLIAARVYLRPDEPEPLAAIAADLDARRIDSLHVLKWRLAAAIHPRGGDGVELDRIWRAWRELAPRAARYGWSHELVATIEAYRGSPTRYYFPTESELAARLRPRFRERARATFAYPLGERCPTVLLAPIGGLLDEGRTSRIA